MAKRDRASQKNKRPPSGKGVQPQKVKPAERSAVEKVFEVSEARLARLPKTMTKEDFLNQEPGNIYYLKDVVQLLELKKGTLLTPVQRLIKQGEDPYAIMGLKKPFTHWMVNPTIFNRWYALNAFPAQIIPDGTDANSLLQLTGYFYLVDVCKHIPFTSNQIRYHAHRAKNPLKKYGVVKNDIGFLVEMGTFSRWITFIWTEGFNQYGLAPEVPPNVFGDDERTLIQHPTGETAEELFAQEGVMYLKDVCRALKASIPEIKWLSGTINDNGGDSWTQIGVRKAWTHWIVRISVFREWFHRPDTIIVHTVDRSWSTATLLSQTGYFSLREVCTKIPFNHQEVRSQAQQNPNTRIEYGVWKDEDMGRYLVKMEVFSEWLRKVWHE